MGLLWLQNQVTDDLIAITLESQNEEMLTDCMTVSEGVLLPKVLM